MPEKRQNKLQRNWLYQIILSIDIFYHYYNSLSQLNIPNQQAHFQSHHHQHYSLNNEHFAKEHFPIHTKKKQMLQLEYSFLQQSQLIVRLVFRDYIAVHR